MTSPNPNPSRITTPLWYFWLKLSTLAPGSQLGGIYANKSGYHNTRAANDAGWPGNYSVRDSVDRIGPNDKSAAVDWTFPEAHGGDYSRISLYCGRLMRSGKDPDDPRLDVLREWYGQADSDSAVEGWDCRYLREITSDPSHLWHIHFSFSRNQVLSTEAMDAVLSVLRGETVDQWRGITAAPGKVVPMFVVEKRLPGGSSWYVTDGLRWRTLITWNEVTVLRAVTGRPSDVVVTDQTTFDLLCGSQDAPEGTGVDLLTDEQVNALASRITTAFDATEIRQVLREELGSVRLVPGEPE